MRRRCSAKKAPHADTAVGAIRPYRAASQSQRVAAMLKLPKPPPIT